MDERTLLVIVREEEEGEGTNARNEKKMGKDCPPCAEKCAVHSIAIRRLLFKPDEARRGERGRTTASPIRRPRPGKRRGGTGKRAGKTLPKLTTWGMHEVARRERWKIPLLSLSSLQGWAKKWSPGFVKVTLAAAQLKHISVS